MWRPYCRNYNRLIFLTLFYFAPPLILPFPSLTQAFTVDVLNNITVCKESDKETGNLYIEIREDEIDPEVTAEFLIPHDLLHTTYVSFESHAWDGAEWVWLFEGNRSLCDSIVLSNAYKQFSKRVQPNFPSHCPIEANSYNIERFPISGQWVVLSDIKNAPPLVRHKIKLMADPKKLILCREVYTRSSNIK